MRFSLPMTSLFGAYLGSKMASCIWGLEIHKKHAISSKIPCYLSDDWNRRFEFIVNLSDDWKRHFRFLMSLSDDWNWDFKVLVNLSDDWIGRSKFIVRLSDDWIERLSLL